MKVAIRVDGNSSLGMGNIYRSLSLADELKNLGQDVCFIMRSYPGSYDIIQNREYPIFLLSPTIYNGALNSVITEIIKQNDIKVFINDIKNTDEEYMQNLKENGVIVINFDDLGEGRDFADHLFDVFYNNTKKQRKNVHNYGPKYIILRNEIRDIALKSKQIKKEVENITVIMGAANTGKFLQKVINALFRLPENIICNIILSNATHDAFLFQTDNSKKNIIYHYQPQNIFELFNNADLMITAGGVSMCECCALGTPSIVIPQVQHEEVNAGLFALEGAVSAFSYNPKITEEEIYERINELINNYQLRVSLSKNSKKIVDGKGVNRFIDIIRPYLN